jgi:hypothetical protein
VNFEQIALQLGVSGAIVYVVWKVATLLIEKWSIAESERTRSIAAGFAAITGKVDQHHTADLRSHQELGEGIAEIRGLLGRDDSQVKPVEKRRTPPQGVPAGARYHFARTATNGDD